MYSDIHKYLIHNDLFKEYLWEFVFWLLLGAFEDERARRQILVH